MSRVVKQYIHSTKQNKAAARVLEQAFYDDPLSMAMMPDWHRIGFQCWRWFFWIFDSAKLNQVVLLDGDVVAATIWEPLPTQYWAFAVSIFRALLFGVWYLYQCGFLNLFRLIATQIGMMMKKEHYAPNALHLVAIGTSAKHQNKGLGGQILKAGLDQARAMGRDVYLESSNPRNVPFYKRHGFGELEKYYPFAKESKDGKGCLVTLMICRTGSSVSTTDEKKSQ